LEFSKTTPKEKASYEALGRRVLLNQENENMMKVNLTSLKLSRSLWSFTSRGLGKRASKRGDTLRGVHD